MVPSFALYYCSVYSPLLTPAFQPPSNSMAASFLLASDPDGDFPEHRRFDLLARLDGIHPRIFHLYYAKFRWRGVVKAAFTSVFVIHGLGNSRGEITWKQPQEDRNLNSSKVHLPLIVAR